MNGLHLTKSSGDKPRMQKTSDQQDGLKISHLQSNDLNTESNATIKQMEGEQHDDPIINNKQLSKNNEVFQFLTDLNLIK